jgi:hypothetical protein
MLDVWPNFDKRKKGLDKTTNNVVYLKVPLWLTVGMLVLPFSSHEGVASIC